MKLEVADDCRVQKRHGVGGDGIAKPRMKFFGYRSAADDVAPFEYRDFEPRRGQIRGADQSVVASADNHRVAR